MALNRRMINFSKRWNITTLNENQDFEYFKNHILFSLDKILGKFILTHQDVSNSFAYMVGCHIPPKSAVRDAFVSSVLEEMRTKVFNQDPVYVIFANAKTTLGLVVALQYLFWALEKCGEGAKQYNQAFIREVQQALDLSPSINIRLVRRGNCVLLYPAGAKLLDEVVINDSMLWLEDYPDILKHFEEALKIYSYKDVKKYRNLLDNLRFAVEQLLRAILGNSKSLENQKDLLLPWLKEHNINQQVIGMFNELFFQKYRIYQNELVKHGDNWSPVEIEFIIYLTGTFMRLLLQLHKGKM